MQAEVAHDPGEEDADGRRGDRVGVGEPEVERHRAGFGQKPDDHECERDDHEPVRTSARQHLPDLREVERTRAAVQQRDPGQQHERADRVHDREVDRPLQRR